jgi:hypothetical protein
MVSLDLPWRTLLVAPLASVPVVVLVNLGSSDAGIISDFGWGLFFAIMFGLPLAYAGMALVGLPTYLLLRRLGLVRGWVFCIVGMAVPFSLFADTGNVRMPITAVLSGLAVALAGQLLLPRSHGYAARGGDEA